MRTAFLVLTFFVARGHSRAAFGSNEGRIESELTDNALRSFAALLFAQNSLPARARAISHQGQPRGSPNLKRRSTPATRPQMELKQPEADMKSELVELESESDSVGGEMPMPNKKNETDLNGVPPWTLLAGGISYIAVSVFAFKSMLNTGEYFAANPVGDNSLYIVARIQGIVKTGFFAAVSLGSVGLFTAGIGQLVLAVIVQIGIMKGELDPNKPRVDPYGEKKVARYKEMMDLMQGKRNIGKDWSDEF